MMPQAPSTPAPTQTHVAAGAMVVKTVTFATEVAEHAIPHRDDTGSRPPVWLLLPRDDDDDDEIAVYTDSDEEADVRLHDARVDAQLRVATLHAMQNAASEFAVDDEDDEITRD